MHNIGRWRCGGGPGGGCARRPVGAPSPPRDGRWKPRSRARLSTATGAKRADSSIRRISSCRESHVHRAFEKINICAIPAPRSPARPVRYVFSHTNTHEYNLSLRGGACTTAAFDGEEGTAGSAAGGGCWSWWWPAGKQRQERALASRRLALCQSNLPEGGGKTGQRPVASHRRRSGYVRRRRSSGSTAAESTVRGAFRKSK
jgi:hypothetical protein